jgi:hypothetical protein
VVHVPLAGAPVATVQPWQAPSHEALQHTPSAQKPEKQSAPTAHAEPLGSFGAHVPPEQTVPLLHWESELQPARHAAAPSQRPKPHSLAGSALATTGAQAPFTWEPVSSEQASHVPPHAESQQTASVQKPEAHWLPALQAAPCALRATHVPALQ